MLRQPSSRLLRLLAPEADVAYRERSPRYADSDSDCERCVMLDLHLSSGQGLLIETPSGDVEVWAVEVQPEEQQVTVEVVVPEDWAERPHTGAYKLHQEFKLQAPEGEIRIKVLRFRPRPDGTAGAVSLGIEAPRSWPISR